jgi:HD-like signal output (HDOD) protein/FixJ family two-component response regulator
MARVLVIDSEADVQEVLCRFLGEQGHRASAARNGVEAARQMVRDLPDLILLDPSVPLGGIKTAQLIRLNSRFSRIPILLGILPGPREEMAKFLEQGTKVGVSGFLARPYDRDVLIAKMETALRGRQSKYTKEQVLRRASDEANAGDRADLTTAMEVRTQVRELTDLPTLSAAQQRIISIMSRDDEEVDVDALVQALQSDQGLTMRVLGIARSAYYGFSGNFILTAITFLGMPRIRQIVQSATIMEAMDRQGGAKGGLDIDAVWKHSVACGLVMQSFSRDNQQARHFTAGMLHDVGKMVLNYKFPEYLQAVLETADKESRPMHEVEEELLGITHGEVGQEVAKIWRLPHEISESIFNHHTPSRAQRHKYLSSLVYLADVAVRQMGIGDSGDCSPAEVTDPYAEKLAADLEGVIARKEEYEEQVSAIVSSTPE